MAETVQVPGKEIVPLKLYTLSTCGWCRKTKALLGELGVAYEYIDVDTLPAPEKENVMEDIAKWNPKTSFPTIVVNDEECIVGYDEDKIREVVSK
ncbi:MAG: glutaredoxin family protein [bacterium]